MSKETKRTRYRSLTCEVTSTIPRPKSYRESWIKSLPRQEPRPISFAEGTYCSKENLSDEDLQVMKGQVERWKKYFSAQPLALPPPREDEEKPAPQKDNPVKIVTYRPTRYFPTPTPRRTKALSIGVEDLCFRSLGRNSQSPFLGDTEAPEEADDLKVPKSVTKRLTPRRYTDLVTPAIWKAVQTFEQTRCDSEVLNETGTRNVVNENGNDNKQEVEKPEENESLATTNTQQHQQHQDVVNNSKKQVPDASRRSDATVNGRVIEAERKFDEKFCDKRRPVADDAGGMCDVGRKKSSPAPRVVAASVKFYKDIPKELFDTLPESSVDPDPEDRRNDTPHSDWRNMREGRKALLYANSVLNDVEDYEINRGPPLAALNNNNNTNGYFFGDDKRRSMETTKNTRDRGYQDAPNLYSEFGGFCQDMMGLGGGAKDTSFSFPPPPLLKYSEFPIKPPRVSTPPPVEPRDDGYYSQLDRDLQNAGIFFRNPEEEATPPYPGVSAPATEGEIHQALATLDASLEGFCCSSDGGSSGSGDSESSPPLCSYPSSVTHRESPYAVGVPFTASPITETRGSALRRRDERPQATDIPPASGGFSSATKTVIASGVSANTTVIHVDGGFRGNGNISSIVSDTSAKAGATNSRGRAMESFNLIEEVYVKSKTKSVPHSSVQMKAYYPAINYSDGGSGVPSRSSIIANVDSDSGHESGATSPCETLTGEDMASPPPSPPTSKIAPSTIAYENHLRKYSRSSSYAGIDSPAHPQGSTEEPLMGAAVIANDVEEDEYVGISTTLLTKAETMHFVVVAIDFGTTYSGYAFSFTNDPDNIRMMKKWEGGDPGIQNQKTPTIVLLTPDEEFHSLGFTARDTYHDLDPSEVQKWLYFDKFKMELHSNQSLTRDTLLEATNGKKVPALKIFSFALKYFRDHAIRELSEQLGSDVEEDEVRWVITVPAIWSHPAKQFMRTAAYKASMGSPSKPDQLLIALEPEAAAIYCRRLRQNQLLQERPLEQQRLKRLSGLNSGSSSLKSAKGNDATGMILSLPELDREESLYIALTSHEKVTDWLQEGTVYMVVDCGGGTVDITVHQMTDRKSGHLKELHKATGGPYGSIGVDKEFEKLLDTIFGSQFMNIFRVQRSGAYVELMIAFEARKRNASPDKSFPLNISLPFAFIDFYKKTKGKEVESAIKKWSELGVKWSSQGMLRIEQATMKKMFDNTLYNIAQAIESVLLAPEVGSIQYMFLVGGFAESELLQKHIRDSFSSKVNVVIPQGMGLAILLGAVQFGLDPSVVTVRRSRLTYGVGVLNKFDENVHPSDKKVVAAGSVWCADILDKFVEVDESVAVGDVVTRSYTPATPSQKSVILHLYATERHGVLYVTEKRVRRVGTLQLELGDPATPTKIQPLKQKKQESGHKNSASTDQSSPKKKSRREITVHLKFGGTEVKASAVDHLTGLCVKANIEFLAL